MTFNLTIRNTKTRDNLAYIGVYDVSEFIQRVHYLNFNFNENVYLKMGSHKYFPVLYTFENVSEIEPILTFQFVFVPDSTDTNSFFSQKKIDFVFEDPIFITGMHHFEFERNSINTLPDIPQIKKILSYENI